MRARTVPDRADGLGAIQLSIHVAFPGKTGQADVKLRPFDPEGAGDPCEWITNAVEALAGSRR